MTELRITTARAAIVAAVALAAVAAAIAIWASPAPAQSPRPSQEAAVQSAFVMIQGADTIAVERLTRGRNSLSGDIAGRGSPTLRYVAELGAGPSVPLFSFQVFGAGAPADAEPLQTGSMRITADSFVIEAAGQRVATAATGMPIPLVNLSFGLGELMIARARAASGAGAVGYTGKFVLLQGRGVPLDAKIDFIGGDSAVMTVAGVVHRFSIEGDGRIRGGSVPAQGLAIIRVTGAAATKISLGRPDYGAPAGAPYAAEEVTVRTRAGHVLSGTLTIPKEARGPVPAVVTITGSGQQDRDEFIPIVPNYRPFRQLADTLGRRGIAVLRLDDRGVNGSGGDVLNATSADFADDIRGAVVFLRSRPDIDGARIALFGHSEGGMIGPMVAATDEKLAGIVIFAGPAYTGRKILDFQLRNLVTGNPGIPAAKKDSALKATTAQFDSAAAKGPWMKYFMDYDPIPTLRRVKSPVLIVQGGTDQQVTPEQAPIIESTLKAAGNRDVTLRVFADRNHLLLDDPSGFPGDYAKLKDGRIGPEALGVIADWVVLKLSNNRPRP